MRLTLLPFVRFYCFLTTALLAAQGCNSMSPLEEHTWRQEFGSFPYNIMQFTLVNDTLVGLSPDFRPIRVPLQQGDSTLAIKFINDSTVQLGPGEYQARYQQVTTSYSRAYPAQLAYLQPLTNKSVPPSYLVIKHDTDGDSYDFFVDGSALPLTDLEAAFQPSHSRQNFEIVLSVDSTIPMSIYDVVRHNVLIPQSIRSLKIASDQPADAVSEYFRFYAPNTFKEELQMGWIDTTRFNLPPSVNLSICRISDNWLTQTVRTKSDLDSLIQMIQTDPKYIFLLPYQSDQPFGEYMQLFSNCQKVVSNYRNTICQERFGKLFFELEREELKKVRKEIPMRFIPFNEDILKICRDNENTL